jgi:hypothetical protein
MGHVVSAALDECHKVHSVRDTEHGRMDFTDGPPEDVAPMMEAPKLWLRIFADPCQEDSVDDGGAICAPFLSLGMEIIATELEKVKGWDALRARFERSIKERAGVLYTKGPVGNKMAAQQHLQWPEGYRFGAPKRFWRAKIISQVEGEDSYQEHIVMLVIANDLADRTVENVELDLQDSADTAHYCSRFNAHMQRSFGEAGSMPGLRVCGPVGCEVLQSNNSQFANPGEAVMIFPYPFPEVKKFVFDGSEDFLEIPQAFFHHAAFVSGGREFLCDLQGIEDDESNVLLIDPCILRSPKPGVADLLATLAKGSAQNNGKDNEVDQCSQQRFDMLHPRCSQLCKAFDPHRRSAGKGRHCGLHITACGLH